MKKALLILNCHDKARGYHEIVPLLKIKFPDTSFEISQPQKITDLAKDIKTAIAANFSMIAVGGGDGTIGLAASLITGTQIPMMILPMGTVNAFARSFGIRPNPVDALNHYQPARTKQIDTGFANEHFFLCFMSLGIDALAVHLLNKKLKKSIGKFAYAVSGIKSLMQSSHLPSFVHEEQTFYHLIVSNMSNYAGYEMFPTNDFSDGRMGYAISNSPNPVKILKWSYALATNKYNEHKQLLAEKNMVLHFDKPLFAQLDGEPITINPTITNKGNLIVGIKKESLKVYY